MEKQCHSCRFETYSELHSSTRSAIARQQNTHTIEKRFKRTVKALREHLSQSFKTDCLSYALLKLLPSSLKNTLGNEGAELSWGIKEAYFRMISKSVAKGSEFFEPMAVYLTNLGVRVFMELIPEVEWSQAEGQMCILWYFLLLGVTVSEEVYGQLAKKYLTQNTKREDRTPESGTTGLRSTKAGKRLMRALTIQKQMRTCKSIGSGLTCNSIAGKTKTKKGKVFFRSSAFNKEEVSMAEEYKEEIKNNLAVEVLPPVKAQRVKLKAQHIKTEPCQIDGKSFCTDASLDFKPPKSQSFYPHQVSTTLTSFYPKQPNLKGGKMKRNRFSVSTFKLSKALELSNTLAGDSPSQIEMATETVAERESKPKMEDWASIIHSLKKKVAGMRKEKDEFNRYKKENCDSVVMNEKSGERLTRTQTAEIPQGNRLKQSTNNNKRMFAQLQLPDSSSKIAARIDNEAGKMQPRITQEPDKIKMPNSHTLKKKRRGFEEECWMRKERGLDSPRIRGGRSSLQRVLGMMK